MLGGCREGESLCSLSPRPPLQSEVLAQPGPAASSPHTSELNEVPQLFKEQQPLDQLRWSVDSCRALKYDDLDEWKEFILFPGVGR